MSSWPHRQPDKGGGSRRRGVPRAGCRSLRGRSFGLKAACGIASRRPCGPALTPETTAAPDGSTKGQASSLPRAARGTRREAAHHVWLARKGSSTGIVATTP
jgi:hypothetical protein